MVNLNYHYHLADGVNIKNGRDGVHLTLSREGRPSGEAYVEVASEDDVALAEKKHNQHMGRRYIEGKSNLSLQLCVNDDNVNLILSAKVGSSDFSNHIFRETIFLMQVHFLSSSPAFPLYFF